ncbi:MAG: hypothetical protein ACK5NK_01095 [Niabella sp.]
MRTIIISTSALITIFAFTLGNVQAQTINWNNVSTQKRNLLHINTGADYGMTLGLGYHYYLTGDKLPILIGADLSTAFGEKLADDNKVLIGAHIRLLKLNNFQVATKVQGVFRSYQNKSLRLLNFGSNMAATFGYYRSGGFIAAETGFDKAIVTHFRHSDWYRDNIYDSVQNGWYQPATGGNFYYGVNGGVSFKDFDITLQAGKVLQQDFKSKPLFPFYGKLGVNMKF